MANEKGPNVKKKQKCKNCEGKGLVKKGTPKFTKAKNAQKVKTGDTITVDVPARSIRNRYGWIR